MTIEELHDHLFDVLCIVDDICKKENIRYFLDSGTELGAVREGNFIPWDDDMDIKVLSEDYPDFYDAMKRNMPDYMQIIEPGDLAPAFYDFVVRIIDTRFMLREETEEDRYYKNYQNYVGTDVFIFSKASNSAIIRRFSVLYARILYGLGMAHRFKINPGKYGFVQKMQVCVLTGIGRFIPVKVIYRLKKRSIHKYDMKDAKYRLAILYMLSLNFFDNEYYESAAYFNIRDREFPVPVGYDGELKIIYGDYMVPVRDPRMYVQHLK